MSDMYTLGTELSCQRLREDALRGFPRRDNGPFCGSPDRSCRARDDESWGLGRTVDRCEKEGYCALSEVEEAAARVGRFG